MFLLTSAQPFIVLPSNRSFHPADFSAGVRVLGASAAVRAAAHRAARKKERIGSKVSEDEQQAYKDAEILLAGLCFGDLAEEGIGGFENPGYGSGTGLGSVAALGFGYLRILADLAREKIVDLAMSGNGG